jgi:flagellar biosynthesis/type III secretory pathway M-ring protein FliF/YscJ
LPPIQSGRGTFGLSEEEEKLRRKIAIEKKMARKIETLEILKSNSERNMRKLKDLEELLSEDPETSSEIIKKKKVSKKVIQPTRKSLNQTSELENKGKRRIEID